jgi:hypothetical protein
MTTKVEQAATLRDQHEENVDVRRGRWIGRVLPLVLSRMFESQLRDGLIETLGGRGCTEV